uniref:Protein kinase A anchor protein nuclear localisation signal domain-containing protein n=1 Tax=Ditylenchus dipsaci TaxID=166011 RepID=A0A915CXH7_9BILA
MLFEISVAVGVTALLSFLIFYFIIKLCFTKKRSDVDLESQREDQTNILLLAIERSVANIPTLLKQQEQRIYGQISQASLALEKKTEQVKQEINTQTRLSNGKSFFTLLEGKIDSISEQQTQHENILNNIQQDIGRLQTKDDEMLRMLNNLNIYKRVYTATKKAEIVQQPSTSNLKTKKIDVCISFHIITPSILRRIDSLYVELTDQNKAYSRLVKPSEKLHVTILKAFVKEHQLEKAKEAFVKTMAKLHENNVKLPIMFQGTKCLHNEKNDVLAIDLANKSKKRINEVNEIAKDCFQQSCISVDNCPFDPHLTVVHLKDPTYDDLQLVEEWDEFVDEHLTTAFGTEHVNELKLTANLCGEYTILNTESL